MDAVAAGAYSTRPQLLKRRKTAAERRAQYLRAEARMMSRLLSGFEAVVTHSGNQLSKLASAVHEALGRHGESTASGGAPTQPTRSGEVPP